MTEKNDSRHHAPEGAQRLTPARTESECSSENPICIELPVANGTDRSSVLEADANLRRTLQSTRNQSNGAKRRGKVTRTGEYVSYLYVKMYVHFNMYHTCTYHTCMLKCTYRSTCGAPLSPKKKPRQWQPTVLLNGETK